MNTSRQLIIFFAFAATLLTVSLQAQEERVNKSKFRQLNTELPTPNTYRDASGIPGHAYWQQKADYVIEVTLDDNNQIITGSETITYKNNSPNALTYLWLQLDQNMRAKDSDTHKTHTGKLRDKMSVAAVDQLMGYPDYDGGHKIRSVKDASGNNLPYTINKTMMRVDLPEVLKPGSSYVFSVDWHYQVNDRLRMGGRGGHEYFEEDGNYLYTITQWFPRMAVYDDVNGWQHKQFLGRGEFALTFGNYKVSITVPNEHVVAATGTLQNPEDVLSQAQRKRLEKAKTAQDPVFIVTKKEAEAAEKRKSSGTKTWTYYAENVRDFAFGSSPKYIWDAMGVKLGDRTVMAMSYYPKESYGLYAQYSTETVAHTLRVYSRYTFDYPYAKAISVEASNGMEYPMICFNYGRPEKDGTYSPRIKYGMISVIIHEVGHNYFPMIVNSDERQWTWMDEGLNTFLQYLTEQEWQRDYPSRRGPAYKITSYMKGSRNNIMPIMTNSESIPQFGNNAYGKPAAALNILRESIMGRELFDHAFKRYAQTWKFKHPMPADFFRIMEDASGMDLDWFWRGWFYTTDYVDIAIDKVKFYEIDSKNPEIEKKKKKEKRDRANAYISDTRNKGFVKETVMERKKKLKDFYNSYDPLDVTASDKKSYKAYVETLGDKEKELIASGRYFYEIQLKNLGGLVMPVFLQIIYEDGSKELRRYPAEIWRMNNEKISKVVITTKKVSSFSIDPYRETADVDEQNNYFPPKPLESRFEIYKRQRVPRQSSGRTNPMQQARKK